MNFLMSLASRETATIAFIFCMFTLSTQQLCFVRNIRKGWRILIELFNGISWLITSFLCIGLLYEGWHMGLIYHGSIFHQFTPLASLMYTVRILASFIISGVSFDLASKDILKKK